MKTLLSVCICILLYLPNAVANDWVLKPVTSASPKSAAQASGFEKPAMCPIKLRKTDSYQPCRDQFALLKDALNRAKQQNKLVIVKFGANWCPWCRKLHKIIPSKEVFGFKGDDFDYDGRFMLVEIAVSTFQKGKGEVSVPTGKALSSVLLQKLKIPSSQVKGIPYLMILDPKQDGKGIYRRSKYLESRLFGLFYHYKGVSYEPHHIRLLLRQTWRRFRP